MTPIFILCILENTGRGLPFPCISEVAGKTCEWVTSRVNYNLIWKGLFFSFSDVDCDVSFNKVVVVHVFFLKEGVSVNS